MPNHPSSGRAEAYGSEEACYSSVTKQAWHSWKKMIRRPWADKVVAYGTQVA
jgi:hypothetical protein